MSYNLRTLQAYIKYICDKNIFLTSSQIRTVAYHCAKCSPLASFAVFTFIKLLNFSSEFYYSRPFYELEDKQKRKVVKVGVLVFPLRNKVDLLCKSLALFHGIGNEKIKRRKHALDFNISKDCEGKYSEFCVVGSGPGGAVTASDVKKKFDDVTLLEMGWDWNIPTCKHPGDELLNKWRAGGVNLTTSVDPLAFASGTCFGGGSEINSGLYHFPSEEFLNDWTEKYSAIPIPSDELAAIQKQIDYLTSIEPNAATDEFTSILKQVCDHNSIAYNEVPSFHTPKIGKASMSATLLDSFLKNGGSVKLGFMVERIERHENLWKLHCLVRGKPQVWKCKYLFICCGAIYTNQLLLKSDIGLGFERTLRQFKFHPMVKAIFEHEQFFQGHNEDVKNIQITEHIPSHIFGNAASSEQFLKMAFLNNSELIKYISSNWQRMKMMHATFSLGAGKILNHSLKGEPLVSYKLTKDEYNKIGDGFSDLMHLAKLMDVKSVIPVLKSGSHVIEGANISSFNEKLSPKKLSISSVHVMGGVTSGENNRCVADSYGRVKGYKNLFVNDSSLINNDLLLNPQGTVMAIAYKNVRKFFRDM